MKTLKWYAGLMIAVFIIMASCTKEEVNLFCLFEAFFDGSDHTFDECRSEFFSDGVFYLYGENPAGNIELGDWVDKTGTQSVNPTGAYGSFIMPDGMVYTSTSGTLEFTKINKDSKLLNGKYDFQMEASTGETMDVNGSFSNVPYTE